MTRDELEKMVVSGQSKLDMMWASMSNDRSKLLNPLMRIAHTGTPETREEALIIKMCISIVGLELDIRDARRALEDK